jgi:VanZ family protein
MVGLVRFELTTSCTPCKRATRLRYSPKNRKSEQAGCLPEKQAVFPRRGPGRSEVCPRPPDREALNLPELMRRKPLENPPPAPDPAPGRIRWVYPLMLAATILLASSRAEVAAPDVAHVDKLAHLLIYGLLATLVARSLPRRQGWLGAAVAALFGVLDELWQSRTPGRVVELADWYADSAGAILAVTLYLRWGWYRRWLEMPVRRPQRRIANGSPNVPDHGS